MEIWVNTACSRCPAATEALDEAGVSYTVRRYLDEPPTRTELEGVLARLGLEPWHITRAGEPESGAIAGLARTAEARDQWLEALLEHPQLIQRPIITADDGTTVVGRDPESLAEVVRRSVSAPVPTIATMDVLDWLLDGDPAIRWQVLRDLVGAPDDQVDAERARVETDGWGARLLALRDPDGQWDGGACFPRRIAEDWRAGIQPDFSEGQPWTSTLPTLMLLRDLGLDPASPAAIETTALVAANCTWEHDAQAFFDGEVEPCINGRTLAIGAYFGADVDGLASRLLEDQLDDGGWNCEAENGATVSSFDSTICVLEGLLEYESSGGPVPVAAARWRGEE
jgi:arsenate reductase (glutaredoxin)